MNKKELEAFKLLEKYARLSCKDHKFYKGMFDAFEALDKIRKENESVSRIK